MFAGSVNSESPRGDGAQFQCFGALGDMERSLKLGLAIDWSGIRRTVLAQIARDFAVLPRRSYMNHMLPQPVAISPPSRRVADGPRQQRVKPLRQIHVALGGIYS